MTRNNIQKHKGKEKKTTLLDCKGLQCNKMKKTLVALKCSDASVTFKLLKCVDECFFCGCLLNKYGGCVLFSDKVKKIVSSVKLLKNCQMHHKNKHAWHAFYAKQKIFLS